MMPKRPLPHWTIPIAKLPAPDGDPRDIYSAIAAGREGRWGVIEERITIYCMRQFKRGLINHAAEDHLWHALRRLNDEARLRSGS